MLRITQLDSGGDNLLNTAGEMHLYSTGDKLPESTGEMIQLWRGSLSRLRWENSSTGVSCILPGNILIFRQGILRLSGMLVEGYLYTPLGNIKIFWGYPTFPGLIVDQLCLGESIADFLIVASLSGE